MVSKCLYPTNNNQIDEHDVTLENRMRFLCMAVYEVTKAAGNDKAVSVTVTIRDGFNGGNEYRESILMFKSLYELSAHGFVWCGGYVSKAPMCLIRGSLTIRAMCYIMKRWWVKYGVRMFDIRTNPSVTFNEAYVIKNEL